MTRQVIKAASSSAVQRLGRWVRGTVTARCRTLVPNAWRDRTTVGWFVVGLLLFHFTSFSSADDRTPRTPTKMSGRDTALATPVDSHSAKERDTRYARVADQDSALPQQGQVWRDYDLRPYLARYRNQQTHPEQEVIDWILRETGTERWFGATPGMISFEQDKLRIWHVPEIHQVVADLVDRFVDPDLNVFAVSVRLITVDSANWRAQAQGSMQSVRTQTPGVEAWIMPREDASLLMAQLRLRLDVREPMAAGVQIPHAGTHVLERWQPRVFPQSVDWGIGSFGAPQVQMGQFNEGFRLQLSPLAQADGTTMDCVVKCQAEQLERLMPVWMSLPAATGKTPGVQIEVPQVSSWRIHERFRWPTDQVLVISRGVVGIPGMKRDSTLPLPNVLGGGPARADALLFLECQRSSSGGREGAAEVRTTSNANYRGRY